MKTIKKQYVLIFIICIAGLMRFWQLGINPPSLYWDEVSQAFNAYSILETGRDEHREAFPIARFKAFGDYKAPVYIYATVPSIAIFGKTEVAVRFPSALFGTLTVLLVYFVTREIFYNMKDRERISLVSAFLLAISPWHVQLSRAAYEANIATFFSVAAIFLYLLAVRRNPYLLLVSAISFVLAFYAFNAHRIFVPLIVLLLAILNYKFLLKNIRVVLFSGILGLILLLPFIQFLQTPESTLRFQEVNIFSDVSVIEKANGRMEYTEHSLSSKIFDNRRVLFSMLFLKHYFDFFDPMYLFFTGDENPRFSLQDNGVFYLFELPLLLVGAFVILTAKNRKTLLIVGWVLLAPIAAATARETPHALRSETFIPIFQIIGGVGGAYLLSMLLKRKVPYFTYGMSIFTVLVIGISVAYFLHNYFIHFPIKYAGTWQYGYKEAVEKAEEIKGKYDRIIFTSAYGRPYIYVAWYGDYTPQMYWEQSTVTRDPFGFYNVEALGKYRFRANIISELDDKNKTLYVIEPNEVTSDMKIIDEVNFLNGEKAFLFAVRE